MGELIKGINTILDKNTQGETLFDNTVGSKETEDLKPLVQNNAQVNDDNSAFKALLQAVENGDLENVALLFKKGANVNAKDINGLTPLHHAAAFGYENIVNLLLEKGADVNARDINNLTPLHYAASMGYVDFLNTLIREKSSVDIENKYENPIQIDAKPLRGYINFFNTFIKVKAIVNIENKIENNYNISIQLDSQASIGYLSEASKSDRSEVLKGYIGVINALKEKGADVNAQDKWLLKPQDWAALGGQPYIIMLVKVRTDLNSQNLHLQNRPKTAQAGSLSVKFIS